MSDAQLKESTAAYQIGEVAERIGLSQRTIRHYDDLGIVKPSARTSGGFRLYTQADVDRFLLIKPLKPLGIGLDTVRTLLGALDTLESGDAPEARARVESLVALVAERRAELEAALDACEQTVAELRRALSPSVHDQLVAGTAS